MCKVSILMPTYNDGVSIRETLDSIVSQTLSEWELIIIDDGSTDDTKKIVDAYIANSPMGAKMRYLYQENRDQLLAIINGSQYITGEYVYILHSDDLFFSDDALERAASALDNDKSADSVTGDLAIIDADGKPSGTYTTTLLGQKKYIPALQLLWLGRNLYTDMAMHRRDVFSDKVMNNYLTWNTPFWLNLDDNASMLNVIKLDAPIFKYRVFEGNLANSELGLQCLINGELRCATRLMQYRSLSAFTLQYSIFRTFNKLGLIRLYRPVYFCHETKNKAKLLEFLIGKRYPGGYADNQFLRSLVSFYKTASSRTVDFDALYSGEEIFAGNGLRSFSKMLLAGTLPPLYTSFMSEMEKGFGTLAVSHENYQNAVKLSRFLCIYPFLEITEKH